MRDAVKAVNQQVKDLAPVINTPSLKDALAVSLSDASVPVDFMVKRTGGATYVFAVGMRPGPTTATFTLAAGSTATAEVLGESRSLPVSSGKWTDAFTAHAVHIYKIP